MNGQRLLIGIIAICWGSGMIYYAQAKDVPPIVKLFISSWWIKSERVNRILATILGIFTLISGFRFIISGLTG
jgi:hypothetical protein